MYRKTKKSGSVVPVDEYKKYKKILDNVCRESKRRFYNNRLQQAGTNGREIGMVFNQRGFQQETLKTQNARPF